MKEIKWLHLSDIHINKPGFQTHNMRNEILEYLRAHDIECDYVFFTGDIRYAPSGNFSIDQTVSYLRKICETVHTPLDHLFVIPGNHDINRDLPYRKNAINNIYDYYADKDGFIADSDLQDIYKGKEEFIDFITSLYKDHPDRIKLYTNALSPHFFVTTDDFNIIHVDSTLTYQGKDNDRLIIGACKLDDICNTIDESKPSIILSHYSYDLLDRNEQKLIDKILHDHNIQIWLAGHEHNKACKEHDGIYEFMTGNLYLEQGALSCFLLGTFNTHAYTCQIKAHAWFNNSGWAEYPYLDNYSSTPSQYDFKLSGIQRQTNYFITEQTETIPADQNIPVTQAPTSTRINAETINLNALEYHKSICKQAQYYISRTIYTDKLKSTTTPLYDYCLDNHGIAILETPDSYGKPVP